MNYVTEPLFQTVVDETIDASLNQGQLTKEELIAQKQKESLAKRRSFLVRMVSDPKCYNPKIVRHLNMANHRKMSQDLYRDRTLMQVLFGSFKKVAQLFCTSSGKQSPIANVPVGCLSPPALNTNFNFEEENESMCIALSQTGLQTPI
ncbi:hypothetical protein ANCCAN_13093 [Ancylostoma caninum]|uniref:Uncharacterized protein n=1 Tax=Ancylostoma caninum TaxID=29170 RepID=A0A368G991_ANCCA|nr:hypothetical protein ANCCAN_13093 [Ancylostoma caninum]